MNETIRQPRLTAVRTSISEINNGTYIQEENQNYVLTARQEKLVRVNVLAIVIEKEELGTIRTILLDDGTGQIPLRSFEENKNIAAVQAGDVLMVFGKVRTYNQQKYLSAEMIRKVSPVWLKVRKRELPELFKKKLSSEISPEIVEEMKITFSDKNSEFENVSHDFPEDKIKQLIKKLDGGQGALVEDLLERSVLPETEARLKKMLEEGEIFQNLPGRVKVL